MKKKIKLIVIFVSLLILTVGVRIYFGMQKEDFFMDETFSYALMNNEYGMIHQMPNIENKWINCSEINDALTIQKSEIFDFKKVYYNQVRDCHPPIYYFLLHTISIFSQNQFSMWTGLSLNILIWIGSCILLFLIGKKIFKDNFYAFFLCILYAFSKGAISNTLLVRMYELLVLNTLLFIYFSLNILEEPKLKVRKVISLIISTVIGFLTHYYFLFIAVPIYSIIFIKELKNKQFKKVFYYISAGGVSGLICLLLYPACINHVFSNGRGVESFKKLVNIKTYLLDIKSTIHLINENLFCGLLIPTGILIIIAIISMYIKNKKEKTKIHINFGVILVTLTSIFYFLIVTKIAPYKAERYFVVIFPLIYIVLLEIIKIFFDSFIKNTKMMHVILVIIGVLFVILNMSFSHRIWYLYKGTNEIYEKIYQQNTDNIVYLYDNYLYEINNDIIRFRKFKNIYISHLENTKLASDLEAKDKIILYLPLNRDDYIDYIINNMEFSKYQYISTSWYGKFYLMEK